MAAGWTWLSFSFIYGQGYQQRPILWVLGLYGLGWLVILLLARRSRLARGPSLVPVLVVAVLARALLVPSQLILENDVYRYVLDGRVVLAGENPYRYSPQELSLLTFHPLASELDTPEGAQVLNRIGYPEIPTIYPPLAQYAFALASWWGGWDWKAQRLFFLLCDLGVLLLLGWLSVQLRAPPSALALYAWNPLVLKEVANSAHVDVIVVLFLLAAMAALASLDRTDAPSSRWQPRLSLLGAGLALAAAIGSKLYPVVLVPAFTLFVMRRQGWLQSAVFSLTVIGGVALAYVPFLDAGWEHLSAGLRTYGSQWRMNEGLFSLLEWLPGNPRLAATALAGSVAVLVPLRQPARGLGGLVAQSQAVLLAWFLLLPAAFPWYALPLSALAVLRPVSALSQVTWVISGMTAAYYLNFYVEYHDLSQQLWSLIRGVEYLVIGASILWYLRSSRSQGKSA